MGRTNISGIKDRKKELKKYMPFYLFLLPSIVLVVLFCYMPMEGLLIAFKDYKMARGIEGSEWVGLQHFKDLFTDPNFYRVLGNTLKISILTLLTTFPVTIIFTLLVNELTSKKVKGVVQTITYMPHFLSWVVVGTFVYQLLSPTGGVINALLIQLGVLDKPLYFMAQKDMFVPIYLISNLWKTTGYSIVIYLATISSIDTTMYDAASIDGANRFQRILYITLPAMFPTMCTMLILSIGSLVSVGFDPIFNLYNDATYQTADVISTYVYRKGMVESRYDFSTAIGLFQNVVSLALVMIANWFARKANPEYKVI
ncbi:ABC transporter permease subunit [Candidatus Ventrimonas sp. KK005]|nr:sugar ABC transporter permease [Lachnospiraceae bacterium]NBH16271.1 sugar ABC transporter permease [Clostridiaceae bacterium]